MEKVSLKYLLAVAVMTGSAVVGMPAAMAQNATNKQVNTPPHLASEQAAGQDVVTGRVVDDNNEPLIGVTVRQGKNGPVAVTDLDGRYTIRLSKKGSKSLTYSYVGMKPVTEQVNGRSSINITLAQDAVALDDVVVVGAYGTA